MQKILDMGAGANPWFARQLHLNQTNQETQVSLWTEKQLVSPHLYCCFDFDWSGLTHSRTLLENAQAKSPGLLRACYVRGKGQKLPFGDSGFDTVILSDVLSIPPQPYCNCDSCDRGIPEAVVQELGFKHCVSAEVFRGLSPQEKYEIIREALRVLKPDGVLVVGLYQTPQYAKEAFDMLDWLMDTKKIGQEFALQRPPAIFYGEKLGLETTFRKF